MADSKRHGDMEMERVSGQGHEKAYGSGKQASEALADGAVG